MKSFILISTLGFLAVLGATAIPGKSVSVQVPKAKTIGLMAAPKYISIWDSTQRRDYAEAKYFCKIRGRQLLSLDSAYEAQWLMNYLKQNRFHGNYWTSGKKPAGSSNYRWESTNQLLAPGLVQVRDFEVPYESCLTLFENSMVSIGPLPPPSGTWYTFFPRSCDAKTTSLICQSY